MPIDTDDELERQLNDPPPVQTSGADQLRDRIGSVLFGTAPSPPKRLGKYRVAKRLGAGAMGEVFEAFDDVLERKVALKLLRRHRISPSATARMIREGQSLARLEHPNVVRVHEVGFDGERPWIAMQFVDGTTLREWLSIRRRTPSELLDVLKGAGRGLAAAHEAGLVHRDFKPDNVLVSVDGVAKVADFGLVRIFEEPRSDSARGLHQTVPPEAGVLLAGGLTVDGTTMGTPAYMPIEQLEGGAADIRSDQFAFCVTAWEALFGERPYTGNTAAELRLAIETGKQKGERARGVSRRVAQALRRGLKAAPRDRFSTMPELLEQLEPPRTWRMAVGVIGTAVASVSLWYAAWSKSTPCLAAPLLEFSAVERDLDALELGYAATMLPFAEATGRRVREHLTTYARTWVETRATACASDPPGNKTALHLACLEHRRLALASVLAQLQHPAPQIIERAIDVASQLPKIADCLGPDALNSAAGRSQRELLVESLKAKSLAAVGRSDDAHALATSLIASAEADGDIWTWVEALEVRARARLDTGRAEDAVADMLRATDLTTRYRLDSRSVELWIQLAWIGASELRDHERAEKWLKTAEAWAARTKSSAHWPELELTAARVLELHDIPAARRAFARLLGRGLPPPLAQQAQTAKAGAAMREGLFDEAARDYTQLLAAASQRYGPRHPKTAKAEYNLGFALDRLGSADAVQHYEFALSVWAELYPKGNPDSASAHIALGNWALKSGNTNAAQRHTDEARKVQQRVFSPRDTAMGELWTLQGAVDHANGSFASAAENHREAVSVYEEKLGSEHPHSAVASSNMGEALLHLGELAPAKAAFLHARSAMTAALGEDTPYLAFPDKGLGLVALRRGEMIEAKSRLEQAQDTIGGIDPIETLEIKSALAWMSSPKPETWAPFELRAVALGTAAQIRVNTLRRLLEAPESE